MMKRIQLIPVDTEEYGEEYNLNLELMLNADGTPTRKMTAFGSFGGLGGLGGKGDTEPFLLHTTGEIDLGRFCGDNEERYTTSNLMNGRAFQEGELFTVDYDDKAITYRVVRIYDPA